MAESADQNDGHVDLACRSVQICHIDNLSIAKKIRKSVQTLGKVNFRWNFAGKVNVSGNSDPALISNFK